MTPELVNILIAAAGVLVSLATFLLGKRYERQHQSLLIRADMLKSVEEWVGGAEKIMQMVADSMAAIEQGLPFPSTYNPSERRRAAQFMGEKSRAVFGILESGSLRTRSTRKLADQLKSEVAVLHVALNQLMELETHITRLSPSKLHEDEGALAAVTLMNALSAQVNSVYALIAKMKTAFV